MILCEYDERVFGKRASGLMLDGSEPKGLRVHITSDEDVK